MWSLFALGGLALYMLVALFGELECFRGTFVAKLHYLATDGLCDGLELAVERVCGRRGVERLAAVEACCCTGRNPVGQGFFLLLLGGCYCGVVAEVFPLLPVEGVPAWHKHTGSAASLLTLALFAAACLSDPGLVTAANLAAHLALYPPDGHLFPRYTDCSTCCRLKPGRSKHCTATGGCVARFDHWCIWLNNAVGLMNTRWFLAFLAATTATAAYGAALCVAAIRGDMRRRGAWELVWNDPGSGRAVGLADDRSLLAAWVFAHYGMAAGVAAFLGIACWIVAGFGGVQVWRVATGVTTNEAFKWEEAAAERRERAANSAVAGAQRLPPNAYDRGWRRNFAEVLFPRQHLARALRASRKTQ